MATILIIDDEAVSRQILSALVRSIDDSHEIKAFACPQEAFDWATKNSVDLVLTDFNMPVMNGTEFIRMFRSNPACTQIPVILVSADNDPCMRKAAHEAGATDFLGKPVDHDESRILCRTLLENAT
jgi:two-component system response regulator RpfG